MDVDFPYRVDGRHRTATTDPDDHVRDLIEQVLFTSPGERVNRPTFGCGVQRLVFAPNSEELASATHFIVQGALQQWVGDLIEVEAVEVESHESTLDITVTYRVRRTQERQVLRLTREV